MKILVGDYDGTFNCGERLRAVKIGKSIVGARHAKEDKAHILQELLAFYHEKEENLIVVGDDRNDMGMLSRFDSYAMQNVASEVRKCAKAVTGSVAELINKELQKEYEIRGEEKTT